MSSTQVNAIERNTKIVLNVNALLLDEIRQKYQARKELRDLRERPNYIPGTEISAFMSPEYSENQTQRQEWKLRNNVNKPIINNNNTDNILGNGDFKKNSTLYVTANNSLQYSQVSENLPKSLRNVNDSLQLAKNRKIKQNKIYNPNYYKLFKNAFNSTETSDNSSIISFSSEF